MGSPVFRACDQGFGLFPQFLSKTRMAVLGMEPWLALCRVDTPVTVLNSAKHGWPEIMQDRLCNRGIIVVDGVKRYGCGLCVPDHPVQGNIRQVATTAGLPLVCGQDASADIGMCANKGSFDNIVPSRLDGR